MNPELESMSINHTDSSSGNSPRSFGGLRSRYHAFLEKHKEPASPSKRALFGQGAINVVIFCALVVAILTVFGIGLSWFNSGARKSHDGQFNQPVNQSVNQPVNQPDGKSAGAEVPASLTPAPAQPAGPAGHADIRSQTAAGKKADGK